MRAAETLSSPPAAGARDFVWEDGERLIRFGELGAPQVLELLGQHGFAAPFAILSGGHEHMPLLADRADALLRVPPGPVPEAAAEVRPHVQGRPLVAIGGGRVIDAAKAIAGADGLRCAAIPTTLSGAEMTPFHRMPAGVEEWKLVRPELVIAVPSLMASQPMPDLAASAMNALAHAIEALYAPLRQPVSDEAASRAVGLLGEGLGETAPDRGALALGALLAGYASGVAGFAVHHAVCQTIVRIAGTPHAQTNAVMLPHFVRLMEDRAPEAIAQVSAALGGEKAANGKGAAERVATLSNRAGVTRLSELGVESGALDEIVAAALQHPALANTPRPPGAEELRAVLDTAL